MEINLVFINFNYDFTPAEIIKIESQHDPLIEAKHLDPIHTFM